MFARSEILSCRYHFTSCFHDCYPDLEDQRDDYHDDNFQVADFGFSRDVMVNNIYERKSEGRLPIRL